MAFHADLPATFADALRLSTQIISANREIARDGVAPREAEILVEEAFRRVTGTLLGRLELFARMRDAYPREAGKQLIIWSHQRSEGYLLQHLTGTQAFFSHEYEVNADVLIPRPETELLVEKAIEDLTSRGFKVDSEFQGLEVGTGSGAISIELVSRFPKLKMKASDFSQEALNLAARNAERILGKKNASRIEWIKAPFKDQVLEPFFFEEGLGARSHFLISNPPYLQVEDEIQNEVRQKEPAHALFAPQGDPLFFYRKCMEGWDRVLLPGASAYFEFAAERSGLIEKLFKNFGKSVQKLDDLNGLSRIALVWDSVLAEKG